ncbi:hypothetical protein SDC9_158520 [bioreactor metagenome]|uniref:Uncharacterized protein n=1 Tax=bioreactor metagenome TaxID=1076179 RepID=A0A645FCX9_9ZZZZ
MGSVEVAVIGQVLNIAHGNIAFPIPDLGQPFIMAGRLNGGQDLLQGALQIAHQGQVHLNVLVDLRGVDLKMDLAGFSGEGAQFAGDAVIKTHANCQQQVGFLNGLVYPGFAVHAGHAQCQRMVAREGAQPQQGTGHRRTGALRQGEQLLHGAADEHAVTGNDDRLFGRLDHINGLLQVFGVGRKIRAVTRQRNWLGVVFPIDGGLLGIFSDVDENRTGAAGTGDEKGLVNGVINIMRV